MNLPAFLVVGCFLFLGSMGGQAQTLARHWSFAEMRVDTSRMDGFQKNLMTLMREGLQGSTMNLKADGRYEAVSKNGAGTMQTETGTWRYDSLAKTLLITTDGAQADPSRTQTLPVVSVSADALVFTPPAGSSPERIEFVYKPR
ncbi:MAG: hypothetical protein H7Y12_02310 [Sphingobacteriaceae bacterium]|nr:hypothetical protein [Cytophagaceae bacterium]